ncbi:MFS transporter [[Actinomadura] parvosata]|uniref:MFS transporter n=1 Tax=[Actinomadura] parvosata TaxID=1955412 RepID=UPI00406C1F7A
MPAYLAGQGFSLLGDEVYYIALVWAATTAGGAAGAALVATAAAVPRALLMLVGGGIADRFGSRAVMVTSDAARMVVIAVTAVLTMGGPDIAVLAVTAVLFGIADAMFMPAAGAMPPRLVEPDRLPALNGMMTFVRRASLMLGAPLGGLLAAGPGPAAAFAFNAATFAVSLVCLLLVRLRPAAPRETGSVRRNIGEGLRTVGSTPVLRNLILMVAVVELGFTGPYNIGLALLAQHRGWGAPGMGFMLTAFGLGAAAGALGAVVVRRWVPAGPLVIVSVLVQAACLGALAVVPALGWALPVSVLVGVTASLSGTTVMTLVQLNSDPARLATVMSVVTLSSYGTVPVANALTGVVAAALAVPYVFVVGALIQLVAVGIGVGSRSVRRVEAQAQRDPVT